MSLNLDARQRAMLQEMGVTVWARPEAAAPAAPTPLDAAPAHTGAHAPTGAIDIAVGTSPAVAQHAAPAPARPPTPVAAATPPARTPVATPPAPASAGGAVPAPALLLHAPQALYPTADPAQTPSALGAGWLIVTEGVSPTAPLGADTGKLLDNMLRAMQLHLHPRVHLAALARPSLGTQAADDQGSANVAQALEDAVHTLQPAMVLVLGHVAARAALGRTEPLGRLRAAPHTLGGRPAVVTYDPAFLLRSQESKAATWADLCRALALVRKG